MHRCFLVETGASFSVFPHFSTSPPCGPALSGVAGQPIPCWGEKQFQLSFDGTEFQWPFLLAAIQFPIIGVDFLRHFGLLVDPAGNRLVDPHLTLQAYNSSPPALEDAAQAASSLIHRPLPTGLFLSSPASPLVHRPQQPPAASRGQPRGSHM